MRVSPYCRCSYSASPSRILVILEDKDRQLVVVVAVGHERRVAGDGVAVPRDEVMAIIRKDAVKPCSDAGLLSRRNPLGAIRGIELDVHLRQRLVFGLGALVRPDLDISILPIGEANGRFLKRA